MSTYKRIMSFLLAMVMAAGMLPMPHAYAEEIEEHEHQLVETVPAATAEAPEETTAAPTTQPEETAPQEETEAPTEPTVPITEETVPETGSTIPEEVVDGEIIDDDSVDKVYPNAVPLTLGQVRYDSVWGDGRSGGVDCLKFVIENTCEVTIAVASDSGNLVWRPEAESGTRVNMKLVVGESTGLSGSGYNAAYRGTLDPDTYYIEVYNSLCYAMNYAIRVDAPGGSHKHNWKTRTVAPTCTSRGYTEKYCTGCDESSKYDYVDTIPHKEVRAEREEPTCTKTGKEKGTKCSYCGKTMSGREEIPKLPHDTNVEIPMVEPTCSAVGKTAGAKCSVCGAVSLQPEDIPTLPHTEEDVAYVPATCTAAGLTAGTKCAVCDAVVQAQEVIPKLPHTEVNAPGVAATCTKDGKADVKFCAVCQQEVAYTVVPALGHDAVDYFCLRCGEVDGAVVSAYGDCGDAIQWFGLKDGTLLIRGAGKMWDEPDIPNETYYKKIVIEEGVTYIGKKAFFGSYAASVSIPGTVSRIGAEAFAESALSGTLTIPEGVDTITTGVFSKCSGITNVSFPDSLSWISPNAFYECINLTSVTFPKNLRYIGNYAFYGCKKLDGDLVIPDMVYYVGKYAFYGCVKLEFVSIGDGVQTIGEFAFGSCRDLEGVGLGDRVNTIDQYAFAYCDNLNAIDLNRVSYVAQYAFANCPMSVGVYLPKEITIAANAFSGCGVRYVGYSGSRTDKNSYVYIGSGNDSLKYATWGYGYSQSDVTVCSHKISYVDAKTPTCTEAGWTEYGYCVNCGAVTQAKIELPALGHKFLTDTGVSPTCVMPGLTTGSHCGHCGLVQTAQEEIPALGHTPKTDASLASTCEQAGLTEGSHCETCQIVLIQQELLPATGHNKVPMPDVPATCYEKGSVGGMHCSSCGRVFELPRKTPMLSHMPEAIPAVAPTCTEEGATEGSHCGNCGEIYDAPQPIPALGHDMISDGELAPTCTEPGHEAGAHCSRCDYVEGRAEIPALDHTMVLDEAAAPTCTTPGNTRGWHCDRCGEVFIEQEIVPALGHDFVDGFCDRCGAPDKADYDLFSGKSLTLKPINPDTGKAYTAKQLTWSMDEECEAFATLKNGKLTAKVVLTKVRIEVVATRNDNGEIAASYTVDIFPAVTQLEVSCDGEIVNGKTIPVDYSRNALVLTADVYPLDTMENIQWTVSDKKLVYAEDYVISGNTVTVVNPTGKAGTVTIKATVNAGVKKNVTVKLQFAKYAQEVRIETPERTTIDDRDSLQLYASVINSGSVSKPGITWSIPDKADKAAASISSNGLLKAKKVKQPEMVTVVATSKDGKAQASVEITILPEDAYAIYLVHEDQCVTGMTAALNVGDTSQLKAFSQHYGEEKVTWSSSKTTVVRVSSDGLITAVGPGTAKITATKYGEKPVFVNIKVTTLVSDMTITTRDGKNLITENGEAMVEIASSKGATLTATVYPTGANKSVAWDIVEGGEYAKISASGKITANKDLTSVKNVTVRATAKDGSGYAETICVRIRPLATGVQIYSQQNGVTTFSVRTPENWWVRSNTTLNWDMNESKTLQLSSHVYPYYGDDNGKNAIQGVDWKSSGTKIATVDENGLVTCLKPGTVTITATARDGSGKKVTFKLAVVKKVTSLTLKEGANLTVTGGKTLNLAKLIQINPSDATNKKLTWSVAPNEYGITISSTGVLKTKKVAQSVTVNIMVTTQDGSGKMLSFGVMIYPV